MIAGGHDMHERQDLVPFHRHKAGDRPSRQHMERSCPGFPTHATPTEQEKSRKAACDHMHIRYDTKRGGRRKRGTDDRTCSAAQRSRAWKQKEDSMWRGLFYPARDSSRSIAPPVNRHVHAAARAGAGSRHSVAHSETPLRTGRCMMAGAATSPAVRTR